MGASVLLSRTLVDCFVFVQDGTTPIYMAAQDGHVDTVRVLVESKADVNAADSVPSSYMQLG